MPERRLTSWKEVAAHLGVSVRTAQRWEIAERLPVRRHQHSSLSSIYADPDELTRWWDSRPPAVPPPSIAVLPFANLDRDEDTEILSDGLTEDLITALSQTRGLRVIARSSSFRFKGSSRDLREVASDLGVAHLVEGSLRRSGRRLRVTAQLIRAVDACHLWAERFDREVDNTFAVQEQLAHAIADSLSVRLLGRSRKSRRPRDAETYNAFLRGRFFWSQRTAESVRRGLQSFEDAIARDPGFAAAHAGLADCYVFLWVYGESAREDVLPKAEAALSRALELDPLLGDAYASVGGYRVVQFDLRGAEPAFRRALELNSGDHRSRHWHALTLSYLGRDDDALAEMEQALELDPFGITVNQDAGRILYSAGRYREAIVRLRHTLTFAPHARWAPPFLVFASIRTGDLEGALAAASGDAVLDAFVRTSMGDGAPARSLLETTGPSLSFTRRGLLHLGLGRVTEALALFKRGSGCFELEALELYPGVRPFIEDRGSPAELDGWFNAVQRNDEPPGKRR
ncbi:MAG TPA: FlgO family outer membrane protein [Vicinamibacterales bacterium]|nr:FlgO family outer membrane protein [Vicinamibacterales bacterium]